MTLMVFAFGAGTLATVNPCGFAVLPAFLAYYLADEESDPPADGLVRLAQGFRVGLAVSGGFALVFTAVGLIVALGVRSFLQVVPWAAVGVGTALVVTGLAMLFGRRLGLDVGRPFRPGTGRGWRRMMVFGAGYAVASMSCTLAVLLAVVAQAVATTSPLHLLGVFVAYAAGAATVLVALSVSAALAKGALLRLVRRLLPAMERLEAMVLVASGAYLVAYWLPSLTGRRAAASGVLGGPSGRLMALLDTHLEAVGAGAGLLVVVGLALALRLRARRHAAGRTRWTRPIRPRV